MAIADTTNTAPLFLEDLPDWGQPYRYEQAFATYIKAARAATEQRINPRNRPKYKLEYQLTALDPAAYSVRRARALLELGGPVVVPIWHAWQTLDSMTSVTVAHFTIATLLHQPFKVGGYAYFVQAGHTSVFRRITALAASAITLAAGHAALPDIVVPGFTNGARVYPCIFGLRSENSAQFDNDRVDQTTETVSIDEL